MQALFATSNKGKLREARFVASGFDIELLSLSDIRAATPPPTVLEVGASYEENAALKATAYCMWSGLPTISDDSGIEFPNLGGFPGVYTSNVGVRRVCEALSLAEYHPAQFVCVVAFAEASGRVVSVRATLPGIFRKSRAGVRADGSLPFSSHFYPGGRATPLTDLLAEGTFLSHRGRALQGLFTALGVQRTDASELRSVSGV